MADTALRWRRNDEVIASLMRRVAGRPMLSLDFLLRLEWTTRRMWGQPLSLRAWDRMTFNDKVTYRRLRVHDPVFRTFCDKLRMRAYVAARLGAPSVPELLGVGERPSLFAERTGPYVLKPNHSSGMVTFVGEGEVPSADQLREAERWLALDYGRHYREWGYGGARPLLLAEEVLRSPDGSYPPPDYKLFTFDGEVELVEVVPGPGSGHRWTLMRPDWSRVVPKSLDPEPDTPDPARPPNLDVMLRWASMLGGAVEFLRVDLYDMGDRVLVGELTPYPGGGNATFHPPTLDAELGRMWRTSPRPEVRVASRGS